MELKDIERLSQLELPTEQREFINKLKCIHRFIMEKKILFEYTSLHVNTVRHIKSSTRHHPINDIVGCGVISSMSAINEYDSESDCNHTCSVEHLFMSCVYEGLIHYHRKLINKYLHLSYELTDYYHQYIVLKSGAK